MSIVVCTSEDSAGAKPSDDILNFSFSANSDRNFENFETDGEHAQDDAGTVHVSLVTRAGGDTISVLNETGVSPEPPIDVIIF